MKFILAAVLGVALAATASAHEPPGIFSLAWPWPTGYEPTLDGDLSEWDIVPDEFRIPFSSEDFHYSDPEGNRPTDFNDLNSEIIVSWSECENKLYVMEKRYDDFYDRNGIGTAYGGDDFLEMHLDGDHGGEPFWFSDEDYPDPDERALNMGRRAQTYRTRFPDLPGSTGPGGETWAWFWVSQSTWHDQPEYMDWGFQIDGQPNQGEATLYIEFSTVMWDEFIWNDPDASIQTDLEDDKIIGLGWLYGDYDGSGDRELPVETWSLSGAWDAWKTSASASDFLLLPGESGCTDGVWCGPKYVGKWPDCGEDFETAVEKRSWGRIKEAFVQ